MITAGHSVILFYKYVRVAAPLEQKQEQQELCERLGIIGRILISEEGINATLSSPSRVKIDEYISALCSHKVFAMHIEDFKHSFHEHEQPPFVGLIVKHVKEIVSTGGIVARPDMSVSDKERGYLTPQQFHEAMHEAVKDEEGTVILDVRAHKEYLVGHFENAVDPKVKNFSEYYAFLQSRVDEMKNKKVLMYCTGGIRCEKASNFLRSKGIDDVHHLKGGIHKYLETFEDGGFFRGKNFVFDKRVLMGVQKNNEVVGKCIECQTPHDEFSGRKVCTVCRDLVLVCDPCYFARHGEVHCTDHQYLKHCYVTFLQYLSRAELIKQQQALEEILANLLEDRSSSKNKRRSIRNQLNKIAERQRAIDADPKAAAAILALQPRPIHCRTCGMATCMGNCWGFWSDELTFLLKCGLEMPAKKSGLRSKRKTSRPSKQGKKQTVATKRKHVQKLANIGRWAEIEKLYGKQILIKAKEYTKNNHVVKTPQEIAREILVKNGLLSSASQSATMMTPTKEVKETQLATNVNKSLIDTGISMTLTKEEHERVQKRRQEALQRRKHPIGSPKILTKKQQELIEMKRREALEKRRRSRHSAMAHAQTLNINQFPVVIDPDPADDARHSLQASFCQQPPFQTSSTKITSLSNTIPRVVTPDNLLGATSNKQTRPEDFWKDFEAAAEIAQWENEHLAEAALAQSEKNIYREDNTDVLQSPLDEHVSKESFQTQHSPIPAIVSISQELAAAAEIIQWENEHGDRCDSPELEVPQYGILRTDVLEIEQNAIEASYPQQVNSKNSNGNTPIEELISTQCKIQQDTAQASAQPDSIAIADTPSRSDKKNPKCLTSPHQSPERHNPTEFIKKHFLEDKLELQVLKFLDMMLS
ncbi:putative Rhodanese-like domain, rhodanase, Rhodanese-like domain superfamily [Plasmopara halstedii]